MFPARLTPTGALPLTHSSSGAVMMPAPPPTDLPPSILAKLFDTRAPSNSLPLDPSVSYFDPLHHDPSYRPPLAHQLRALDIAAALAHRTLPLDTQKQMLDKTLAALATQRAPTSRSRARVTFVAPAPAPPRARFARPTVPSLPTSPPAHAHAPASRRAHLHLVPEPEALRHARLATGPGPRPPLPPSAAAQHGGSGLRPITPPTTGGRVIPGFTPLPDAWGNRTPERGRSPKSPEAEAEVGQGQEDGVDRMDLDEPLDEIVIDVPEGGFGQSPLEIQYHDVGMASLIGEDEDY